MKALAEVAEYKIGWRIISKVRLADDTAIKARTQARTAIYGEENGWHWKQVRNR